MLRIVAIILAVVTVPCLALPPGWMMYLGSGQTPLQDPFFILQPYANLAVAMTDNTAYTPASCALGGSPKIVVVLGQSLFSNIVNDTYTVSNPTKVLNFNVLDGRSTIPNAGPCYQAQTTLLGSTGNGPTLGNPLARMGDDLIGLGVSGVILVPALVGGSSVSQWSVPSTPPYLYNNIAVVARMLAANSLSPTEIVWEQGETDCQNGTSQAAYAASLANVFAGVRSVWPSTPIILNSAETWISGVTCSPIAAAQAAAIGGSVFAGANTDSLGAGDRQMDNTHFNATGSAAGASLLATAINAH